MKYDEKLDTDEFRLVKRTENFCSKLKPIELELGEIKIHRETGWNIYIEVVKKPELIDIIHEINKTFSSPTDKWELTDKFYPHISLKGGKDPDEANRFLEKISQEKLTYPKKITCRTITLARWENGRWQKVKTFRLKND